MMSQVKRKVTPCAALALAAALGLSVLAVPARAAAGPVDKARKGTLTVQMPRNTDDDKAMLKDLAEVLPGQEGSTVIKVHLYKVADINEGGSYIGGIVDGLKDTEFGKMAATVGEDWQKNTNEYWERTTVALLNVLYDEEDLIWADDADKERDVPTLAMDAQQKLATPLVELLVVELTAGNEYSATVTDMDLGLYLAVAETVNSHLYTYSFKPWLLSVPLTESDDVVFDESDTAQRPEDGWYYNYTAVLKPKREQRLGQLVIRKALAEYNATFEGASFVFEVTATLDGETVYHNFHELTFQQANSEQDIVIPDLPVGAEVTVTEVYSGASYTLTTDGTQEVVIPPLDQLTDDTQHWLPYPAEGENSQTAAYTYFGNTYDHRFNGGTSAENVYKQTETKEADGSTGTHWAQPYREGSETAGGQTTEGGTGE